MEDLFQVDGVQHGPDRTKALAELFADTVRALNYATNSPDGTPYPSQVYDVIGHLYGGIGRMPQTINQLSARITSQLDDGFATTSTPERDAEIAGTYAEHMTEVSQHLEMALRALGRAHSAMSDVRMVDTSV